MQEEEDSGKSDRMEKLLMDLMEQRRKSVQALHDQHAVDLMEVGLDPKLAMPKNILEMEKNIISGLKLLITDFQKFYGKIEHKQVKSNDQLSKNSDCVRVNHSKHCFINIIYLTYIIYLK